jgi:hypothetical protein
MEQKEEMKKIEIKKEEKKELMKKESNDDIKWWQFWRTSPEVKTGTKADIDLSGTGTKIEAKETDIIKQGE